MSGIVMCDSESLHIPATRRDGDTHTHAPAPHGSRSRTTGGRHRLASFLPLLCPVPGATESVSSCGTVQQTLEYVREGIHSVTNVTVRAL